MHNRLSSQKPLRISPALLHRLWIWVVVISLFANSLPLATLQAARPGASVAPASLASLAQTEADQPAAPCPATTQAATVYLPLVSSGASPTLHAAESTLINASVTPTMPVTTPVTAAADPGVTDCLLTLAEDATVNLDLADLVATASNPTPSFAIQSGPQHGVASLTGSVLTYTPASNFFGDDELVYSMLNGQGEPRQGVIQLDVLSVNDLPVMTLSASTTSGVAPLSVTFTAAATDVDGDPLSYVWSLSDGASEGNLSTVTHQFVQPGSYTIIAVVSDGQVNTSEQVTVQVAGANQPPVVTLSANPSAGVAPLDVAFAAQVSDPEGEPLTYAWTFGDGAVATGSANTVHPYTQVGVYTATVTVADGQQSASASVLVQVAPPHANQPPTLLLQAAPLTGTAPITVSFTPTASDPDQDPLTYQWAFGDGATSNAATPLTHVYVQAGAYTTTLTVYDGQASATQSVTIHALSLPPVNQPPLVALTATTTSGVAPLDVAFVAKAQDPEEDELTFAWSFGDGVGSSNGAAAAHRFEQPGVYLAQLTVSDGHSMTTAQVTIHVEPPPRNNFPPTLRLTATPDTGPAPLQVLFAADASDLDGDSLTYTWNFGDGATADGVSTLTHQYGQRGLYTATLTVGDGLAVASTQLRILVESAPIVSLSATPNRGIAPLDVTFTATASDPEGDPISYFWSFGDWSTASGAASITHRYAQAGVYTATVTASDGRTNASAHVAIVLSNGALDLTPGALDPSVATNLWDAAQFLYTGPDAVQIGVAPGAIDPQRVAVLRGKVLDEAGLPLTGVHVSILDHPEYGSTQSRTGGFFDLVVNGGGYVTVHLNSAGYLPVQRQVHAPWQAYTVIDDVVMTALDPVVNTVDLTASLPIQVARGSVISDSDGVRQSTLFIPQGAQAHLVLANGMTQTLSTLNIRATEYTVGERGQAAMPGSLPPESGYTYAVELSVDEALAVGATDVRFNQTLYHYLENFLNFPVGMNVPLGYYDRVQAIWVPSPDGRVVQIVAINNGLAELDTNGDGVADNDPTLGISEAERQQLALLYTVGQSLWRVPLTHFTPWDCNWPFTFPWDAIWGSLQDLFSEDKPDDPCEVAGSIIECESQVVGERVRLVGVPYTLNYLSDRTPGRKPYLEIPISGDSLPASLLRIELEVEVGGRIHRQTFQPKINQNYTFYWDGLDVYGRPLQGLQMASVRLGYTYAGAYAQPTNSSSGSFGEASGVTITGNRTRREITLWQKSSRAIGNWDARGLGLGGWSLDVHHLYDPLGQVLYEGNGKRRSINESLAVITTVAGNGRAGFAGDNGPAILSQIDRPQDVVVGPDGSIYIADSANYRIRRITPKGMITTFAGNGTRGFSGDGGLATQAQLDYPTAMALGPDGSLYFVDERNNRIRRIRPNGQISTVAGNGIDGYAGDNGPATSARLNDPKGLAVAADGSLYIADTDNNRVRRVRPDGVIVTVAGRSSPGYSGDDGSARNAKLWGPSDVAIDRSGMLYIADSINHRVRRVTQAGIITTVAGNGSFDFYGDGGAATSASVGLPLAIDVDNDGNLFVQHGGAYINGKSQPFRIRQIAPNGRISTLAGGKEGSANIPEGSPAASATLLSPQGIAIGPDGTLYIADLPYSRIRRISRALPGFSGRDVMIPSEDGSELYQFNAQGRHLATLDAATGAVRYGFTYDQRGLLTHITDGDGNATRIVRSVVNGSPLMLNSPFYNQTTFFYVNERGFLSAVGSPVGDTFHFDYSNDGLLTRMTDPRGNASTYLYDEFGRLQRNENAVGGYQTFVRIQLRGEQGDYTVIKTNALGHSSTFFRGKRSDDSAYSRVTAPNGAVSTTEVKPDGTIISTDVRGNQTTIQVGPDPRWGMLAPVITQITSKTAAGAVYFTMTATRTATLADALNPLSLLTQMDQVTINGRTTRTVLDAPRRVMTTTEPSGLVTITQMDALGRPRMVQTPGLAPVYYNFDPRGRLSRVQQGDGSSESDTRLTQWAYDLHGNPQVMIDAFRGVVIWRYDDAGRMVEQILPTRQKLYYTYDAAGNLTSATNAQGIKTTFEYDAANRLKWQTLDPEGRAVLTEYSYDLAGNLIQVTADTTRGPPDGGEWIRATTQFSYIPFGPDGSYLRSQMIDPVGAITRYNYTAAGDLETQTDHNGQQTTFAYTPQGWLTQVTSPRGRRVTTDYNNDGQPVRITDPRGSVTLYTYDSLGRLQQVTAGAVALIDSPALNQVTTYAYDLLGRLTSVTDGEGRVNHYSYDHFGRLVSERDLLGNSTVYHYDLLDRLVRQEVGSNNPNEALTTSYTYDSVGRLVTKHVDQSGLNLTTQYRYSTLGSADRWNLQAVVDPKGNKTSYTYNALGQLASTTDALGHTWTFDYDNLGRLVRQTDPLGQATSYTVDKRGYRTSLTEAGRTESWRYAADGTLVSYTDFAGRKTIFSFNPDGLLLGVDYPEGTADVGFAHDANGNVVTMYDGLGATLYTYDALNRLVTRKRNGRTVNYRYNAANQITAIGYWGRGEVQYGYDQAGRLTSLTPWSAAPTTYSYRSSGLLGAQSRGNGVNTSYSYDRAGRLTGLRHATAATELNNITYVLDANGNRKRQSERDGQTSYLYDELDRLVAVAYPPLPNHPDMELVGQRFDALGNRTEDGDVRYSYDAGGRLTDPRYRYDANGNLTSDGFTTYEYDAANRLIRTTRGGVATQYAYDGWGNLLQESSGGLTTEFVLDENSSLPRMVGEVRSDGMERFYAYGPEGFSVQATYRGGALEMAYPLLDGLGSVRQLTDASGALTLTRHYDVYGNLRYSTGAGLTRLGYTGELQDAASGLLYLRARHYNPLLGRFLQRDSFGGFPSRSQSLNRYAYAEGNPVKYTDPSGHFIDTAVDLGFIGYDIYNIINDNVIHGCDNLGWNVAALVLDIAGFVLPGVVGLGAVVLATRADDVYDVVRVVGQVDEVGNITHGIDTVESFSDIARRINPNYINDTRIWPNSIGNRPRVTARGHGTQVIDAPERTMKKGHSVAFWTPPNTNMLDTFGQLIERGLVGPPLEIITEGHKYRDFLLFRTVKGLPPPTFVDNPVGIPITSPVGRPLWLSEIFEWYPDGVHVDWAACRNFCEINDIIKHFPE